MTPLPPSDEVDNLDDVPLAEHRGCVLGARHDLEIFLDGDRPAIEAEMSDELAHGHSQRNLAHGSIDRDPHDAGYGRIFGFRRQRLALKC